MQRALIVTVTEGVELLPQAAFLSSSLRALGYVPELLATDFCTAQDGFQTAVAAASPDAIVFLDGLEWREILWTLAGFACERTTVPVVLHGCVPFPPATGEFPARVPFVTDDDALARALGARALPPRPASLPLDYALYGGNAILRRGMGCSLFGDLGTVALIASRPQTGAATPAAALSRLEAPLAKGGVTLDRSAALAPLDAVREARAVEWWDRSFDPALDDRLDEAAGRGLRQTVRLLPAEVTDARLDALAKRGVTRVAVTCDALDDAPELRIPGAGGTAEQVAAAVRRIRDRRLESGVLLVVGLPGESAARSAARCRAIADARPDRVRAIPFEPAGGTESWTWCVAKGFWPPRDHRWNRELYQPLTQPEEKEYSAVLEEALLLVASVQAQGRP